MRNELQPVEDLREVDHGEGPGLLTAALGSCACVLALALFAAMVIRVFG